MEQVLERPAALDVHKAQVTACVREPDGRGGRREEVETFPTTVAGLLVLADWLQAHRVEQVAMEATGVYWKPVWAVLEDRVPCLLVNAAHVKQGSGPQDRRGRRAVVVPAAGGRAAASQLGAAQAGADAEKPHAVSQNADSGPPARGQSAAQAAGGHRHQARLRGVRRSRQVGPGDARRAGRRYHRSARARRSGQGPAAQEDSRFARGVGGPLRRPARADCGADPRAPGLSRRGDRAAVGRDRGADRC